LDRKGEAARRGQTLGGGGGGQNRRKLIGTVHTILIRNKFRPELHITFFPISRRTDLLLLFYRANFVIGFWAVKFTRK
jgi:hypothetical protein